MQFSLRFKQLCKENGVTQKQALADMGMGRNSAQSWIEGRPSADTLEKMAEYFGISTDEVLGVENKKTPTPKGERDMENEEIIQRLEAADEATRTVVLRLLGLQ